MEKLIRKRNSKIAGVCSGFGKYLNLDETIIRIIFVALIFSPTPIITIYLLSWLVIPKEEKIKSIVNEQNN
jgi:phage shock protein PspC (stress-responsive transcriptional regulator)